MSRSREGRHTVRNCGSSLFATTAVLLFCCHCLPAGAEQPCTDSLEWEFPLSLVFDDLPEQDLDLKFTYISAVGPTTVEMQLGIDSDLEDSVWTPIRDLHLPWGRYALKIRFATGVELNVNVSSPRVGGPLTVSMNGGGRPTIRSAKSSTAHVQHLQPHVLNSGRQSVSFDDSVDFWQNMPPANPEAASRKLLQFPPQLPTDRGCGIDCLCEDVCCTTPDTCRDALLPVGCNLQAETLTSDVRFMCSYGLCNLTLDDALACTNLKCAEIADCSQRSQECSIFTPQFCTSCSDCVYVGLGVWCSDGVTGSCRTQEDPECQTSFFQQGDCGDCGTCMGEELEEILPPPNCNFGLNKRFYSFDEHVFQDLGPVISQSPNRLSKCAQSCAENSRCTGFQHNALTLDCILLSSPSEGICKLGTYLCNDYDYTAYKLDINTTFCANATRTLDARGVCQDLTDTLLSNATECEKLIRTMWCSESCEEMMSNMILVNGDPFRLTQSQADGICADTCFFDLYRRYLVLLEAGSCENMAVDSEYLPKDMRVAVSGPHVPALIFPESICDQDSAGQFCVPLLESAAAQSEVRTECLAGRPLDDPQGLQPVGGPGPAVPRGCTDSCKFALAEFIALGGCCVNSVERVRYVVQREPDYLLELANACELLPDLLRLVQVPCQGYLQNVCGKEGGVCADVEGGSYECECAPHYRFDAVRQTCVDIDECAEASSALCHANAACINTPGSFVCRCQLGYSGDGVEECQGQACGEFRVEDACELCDGVCCENSERVLRYPEVVEVGCTDPKLKLLATPTVSGPNICYRQELVSCANIAEGGACAGSGPGQTSYCTALPSAGLSGLVCARNSTGGPCSDGPGIRVLPEREGPGVTAKMTCSAAGSFNASIQCTGIQCPPYRPPPDGYVVPTGGRFYTDAVFIACNAGFEVFSNASVPNPDPKVAYCQEDGSYSQTDSRCGKSTCGTFESMLDREQCTTGELQAQCKAECCGCMEQAAVCRLPNAPAQVCLDCSVRCRPCVSLAGSCHGLCDASSNPNGVVPPLPVNPLVSYLFLERASLRCPDGFRLAPLLSDDGGVPIGTTTPMCEGEGDFEPWMVCLPKTCRIFSVPNGQLTTSVPNVIVGNRVTIQCNIGYYLAGNGSRAPLCVADGDADPTFEEPAVCLPYSCGVFQSPTDAQSQYDGQEVFFGTPSWEVKCNIGFQPALQTAMCQAGNSSAEFSRIQECEPIMCPELFVRDSLIECPDGSGGYMNCPRRYEFVYPEQYQLTCNLGFRADGLDEGATANPLCTQYGNFTPYITCAEVDECLEGTDDCDQLSTTCMNSIGSFTCPCKIGFSGGPPNTCPDIDECTATPCDSDAFCDNTFGSYECNCNVGFAGSGLACSPLTLVEINGLAEETIVGFSLSEQPILHVLNQEMEFAQRPWSEPDQKVIAELQRRDESNGGVFVGAQGSLLGNYNLSAPQGIARYTNLEVTTVGTFRIAFSMLAQWQVAPHISVAFTVFPGPPVSLVVEFQPALTGTTYSPLPPAGQPGVAQADIFGNINTNAPPIPVTVRSLLHPDHTGPIGYRGGEVANGVILTDTVARARFTRLTLYGLGKWQLQFEALLNFRVAKVNASQAIELAQLVVPELNLTLSASVFTWDPASIETLELGLGVVCNLPVSAIGVRQLVRRRRNGEPKAGVSIFTSNYTAYHDLIVRDVRNGGVLAALGVTGVELAGQPAILAPVEVIEVPEEIVPDRSMKYQLARDVSDAMNMIVITGFSLGLALAGAKELASGLSDRPLNPLIKEASLAAGSMMHIGFGVRSGGAFRSLMHQAQFVALAADVGGRWGQRHWVPEFNKTWDNRTHESMLPDAMRLLSKQLDWVNLRSNITDVLSDRNALPRPCDILMMESTLGTFFLLVIVLMGLFILRAIVLKIVEIVSLRRLGETRAARNLHFPNWEMPAGLFLTIAAAQCAGTAIGSGCDDWEIGGSFIAVIPCSFTLLVFVSTWLSLHAETGMEWDSIEPQKRWKKLLFGVSLGRWIPKTEFRRMSAKEKYVTRFVSFFADCHSKRLAPYYNSFVVLRNVVLGLVSSASADSDVVSTLFVAFFSFELFLLLVMQPYRDKVRNVVEVILAVLRLAVVIMAFQFLHGDRGDASTEKAMVWMCVAGISLAMLYFVVALLIHFIAWIMSFTVDTTLHDDIKLPEEDPYQVATVDHAASSRSIVAHPKGMMSHFAGSRKGLLVAPPSGTQVSRGEAFKSFKRLKTLPSTKSLFLPAPTSAQPLVAGAVPRFACLYITIVKASGLALPTFKNPKHIARRVRVVIGPDPQDHFLNFGGRQAVYVEGETIFETRYPGQTEHASETRFGETTSFDVRDDNAWLTFLLIEKEGLEETPLGSVILEAKDLVERVAAAPEYRASLEFGIAGPGEARREDDLKGATLRLDITGKIHKMWPMNDPREISTFRAGIMGETYVEDVDKEEHERQLEKMRTTMPSERVEQTREALAGRHQHTRPRPQAQGFAGSKHWRLIPHSEDKVSPWREDMVDKAIVDALIMREDAHGHVHPMEPHAELKPPRSPPAIANGGAEDEPQGDDQGWHEPAFPVSSHSVSDDAVSGQQLELHSAEENGVAAHTGTNTSRRPQSLAVGAGTQRREQLDQNMMSSAGFRPK